MSEFKVGQKVTLVETNTPGTIVDSNSFNIIVEDESGQQHTFVHGTTKIVPQSYLTENN